eukprot:CAMPEP_0116095396 /NCGR_PEP_ID=MMETSP0327-20121206/9640_1 /TAXON_ID=44447 /ORGANISM="Pseudo-nitzschia delicatissima, Strain B596" /LENGTH=340 /DNA_ID=CAMNT_0003587059 /DNA_START=98 /DNA_END=1120 /DNA_ORIENTATION=-
MTAQTETAPSKEDKNTSNRNGKKFVPNEKKKIATCREYGGDASHLIYKSGIPTLRASAHRVKFKIKHRKHDPKPVDRNGNETGTTWIPEELQEEQVFSYDPELYDINGAVSNMLRGCDSEIVGSFETSEIDQNASELEEPKFRLEDFRVPVSSVWRSVNGGCCEDAQKYLSNQVATNKEFLDLFDKFVTEVALPYVKARLVVCGALESDSAPCAFYYQRPPTLRLQPGPGWAKVRPHNDVEYGHQNGELNMWIPLTDRNLTGVDLWSETTFGEGDYHPIKANVGEAISWHGSSRKHYVNPNASKNTRVSLDFRIGVEGYFDPLWEMQGTTDDHSRKKVEI